MYEYLLFVIFALYIIEELMFPLIPIIAEKTYDFKNKKEESQ